MASPGKAMPKLRGKKISYHPNECFCLLRPIPTQSAPQDCAERGREVAQWSRMIAVLPEALGSVPSTHMGWLTDTYTVQGDLTLFWLLWTLAYM